MALVSTLFVLRYFLSPANPFVPFQSRTNLSSLSEPASQTPVEATIFPNDQLCPNEVFEKICGEMRELCEGIKKQYRDSQRSAMPAPVAEKTVVMQEMSTLLENKTSLVNKMAALVKESKYDGIEARLKLYPLGLP